MLKKLSEQIRECHQHVAEAKAHADATNDPALKKSCADLEDRWLFIACSHMLPVVGQLLDLLPVAICVCDASGLILYYNKHAAEFCGQCPSLDATDGFCGSRMDDLDDSPREHSNPVAEVLRSGESIQNREIVVERADGSRAILLVSINPFKDHSGHTLGAINCFRDITERERNERQMTSLLGEAEHRTRNILATVQAAVHLAQSDTVAGLKETIEARIAALARVHELLAQSRWAGADLSTIAEQELAAYLQKGELRARIDGPYVLLAPKVAQAVAMILHELSTNAAKYGSLSVPQGAVKVTWSWAAGGWLILRWIESGGPSPNEEPRKGFGSSIVDRMVGELKGNIHRDWRAQGLACQIALQLTAVSSETDKRAQPDDQHPVGSQAKLGDIEDPAGGGLCQQFALEHGDANIAPAFPVNQFSSPPNKSIAKTHLGHQSR